MGCLGFQFLHLEYHRQGYLVQGLPNSSLTHIDVSEPKEPYLRAIVPVLPQLWFLICLNRLKIETLNAEIV